MGEESAGMRRTREERRYKSVCGRPTQTGTDQRGGGRGRHRRGAQSDHSQVERRKADLYLLERFGKLENLRKSLETWRKLVKRSSEERIAWNLDLVSKTRDTCS